MSDPKEFVLKSYPLAECSPVFAQNRGRKIFQGFFVTSLCSTSSIYTRGLGEGYTEEEAWRNAAERVALGTEDKRTEMEIFEDTRRILGRRRRLRDGLE